MKRTWSLPTVLQIVQKILASYWPFLYLSIGQVWWLNELWFKRYIQKCTLSRVLILIMAHHLLNHGIFKNKRTWIYWERNMNFLRNKNPFVAEVTFKNGQKWISTKELHGNFSNLKIHDLKTCIIRTELRLLEKVFFVNTFYDLNLFELKYSEYGKK